jgi:hypothetical protein
MCGVSKLQQRSAVLDLCIIDVVWQWPCHTWWTVACLINPETIKLWLEQYFECFFFLHAACMNAMWQFVFQHLFYDPLSEQKLFLPDIQWGMVVYNSVCSQNDYLISQKETSNIRENWQSLENLIHWIKMSAAFILFFYLGISLVYWMLNRLKLNYGKIFEEAIF